MLAILAALALVGGVARAALARSADCVPLPRSDQGSFRRADSKSARLELGSCTFRMTMAEQVAYEGEYTVTSGTASSGRILVSHDRGCVGERNYPASYEYAFTRDASILRLQLADVDDFCSGRHAALATSPFLRVIEGRVQITFRRPTATTFKARGAIVDAGRIVLRTSGGHVIVRLRGTKGSLLLRVTNSPGRWFVVSGTGAYLNLRGNGREAGLRAGARVVLAGHVTNI